jgi:hypothetical protein
VTADRPSQARRLRPERLLPLMCIAAAVVLFASEFMTTFELTGADLASTNTTCTLDAASRHHFALGVLAAFAIFATLVAVLSGSKPAAIGVAIAGLIALLLFLIVDLPDTNSSGTLPDSCTTLPGSLLVGEAQPQAGFWLEMAGALALALSGILLATLSPSQLAALHPRWLGGPRQAPAAPLAPSGTIPSPDSQWTSSDEAGSPAAGPPAEQSSTRRTRQSDD